MIMWRALVGSACSLLAVLVTAQPGGPSFCFVLAEDQELSVPLARPVSITYIARERLAYVGINATYAGPLQKLRLEGGPLFTHGNEGWMKYSPPEQICTEAHLLIAGGKDTMRIDLPEDPIVLVQRALTRWDRDTPEVIRFKHGRYVLTDLIEDAWAMSAAKVLADRLIAEEDATYRKQLADQEAYYSTHPTPPPTVKHNPPPQMTPEGIEREIAARPGLDRVDLEGTNADTVRVRITGSVMLDGGCASSMPLFALELLTDTGWVERMPMHDWQLDCGMATADWIDRQVTIPLAWWMYNFRNGGDGLLAPGTCRLRFRGANMKDMRTATFIVRPPDR